MPLASEVEGALSTVCLMGKQGGTMEKSSPSAGKMRCAGNSACALQLLFVQMHHTHHTKTLKWSEEHEEAIDFYCSIFPPSGHKDFFRAERGYRGASVKNVKC